MNPICNLPEEEREGVLGLFSGRLSQEQEDQIRRLFPQYLFFRNETPDDGWHVSDPVRVCTCTACGEHFEAVRGNYARGKLHNEECNCPNCNERVTGKAIYKHKYEMRSLESWIKAAIVDVAPSGALLIEAGDARRRFNWDELTGEIDWYPNRRYYFAPGTVQMWYDKVVEWGCGYPARREWEAKKTISEPFAPNMMGMACYEGDYCMIGLSDALEHSAFQYCQIGSFYHYEYGADILDLVTKNASARWLVKYLAWYALHPQIEMAVKMGLSGAVCELIQDGRKNARLLDWSARRPDTFLRASKEDARLFMKCALTFSDLKDWRSAKGVSLGRWLSLVDQAGGIDSARELNAVAKTARVSFERALHYIKSLRPACARGGVTTMEIIRIWKDYLAMAEQLGYDLNVETVRLPKDLKDRHDAAAAIIRHESSEKEKKRYGKRRKQLEEKFTFELNGLKVLVPASSQEIVQEGKTLHHCVGGYAARHLEGTATILFLRKSRTPGRSFLTIELYEEHGKWKLRQIHGYRNEGYAERDARELVDPAKRYAWFLDTWLSWVNAGSERNKSGLPVLPEKEEVKTA